ncbi:aminotransferase class V-fold PLP-dependent enzyme [Stakelama saccharophila]|uniref:Aminotransferase class V-fold PLP-dependent enzyme n=1 Tax=Stakelama saccharophila TaxID=3075605 RepID=A0ABZ0BBJ2_9SPHN|nr:aminotransferase class V-fold PLP-dependent enzyme [Stakelama sp. W311]WNO54800.1 aminotransferase class V-fold PLP-dependent enzyme [Stakelama sp. W311]
MSDGYKHLFRRSLAAAPERLHFAAHSHHLWPDASHEGQMAAWEDAARFADRKWSRVMDEVWPAAQRQVAEELSLPDPDTVVFAGNTHDFLVRILSAIDRRPVRILTSEGEFHSFRRQAERWVEGGTATVDALPVGEDLVDRLLARAGERAYDLILVSQVMFGTGLVVPGIERLAAIARPDGPWVVIDGYHGFMAVPTDLSAVADRVFYLAGGYKYAMAGEGVGLMHAPPGFGPRPEVTGWYAAFDDLASPPGSVGYAPDARRFMGATFDPSGLYRFVAVRDMLAREGLDMAAMAAHADALKRQLLGGLGDTPLAGAELCNPPAEGSARFLAFRSPDAQRWQQALSARDIVTDARGDVLRIGFGPYQDEADVAALLQALARL